MPLTWFRALLRKELFQQAVKLHKAGILHNDLHERNITRKPDGTLSIIDYGHAEPSHECEGEKKCYELRHFAYNLGLVKTYPHDDPYEQTSSAEELKLVEKLS